MTSRASTLLHVLSTTAFAVALVGCGNGQTFGIAPGPPPPPEDAGDVEPPPPPPEDAGPQPVRDAGPQPDAGDGCTTTVRDLTPDEDFAEFTAQGLPAHFACATCHASSGNPSGRNGAWGPSDDADNAKRWFDGSVGLLSQSDQASLTDPTATRLYASFAGGIGGSFASQHLDNKPEAKAAVENWLTERMAGVTETVCVDAGPSPDPDPVDCTPTLPTEAESEARFESLGIGSGVAAYNCQLCHVGAAKSGTGQDQAWGATTDDSAGWHDAFYGKALQESPTDVTQSVLYTHLNGSDGTHGVKAAERDATEEWLDYVLNGEVPAGCP